MLARSDRTSDQDQRAAIKSQTSRWDALGPSSESTRRRPRNAAANKGRKPNPSHGGRNRPQREGKGGTTHSLRPCGSVSGISWRRRAANDVGKNIPAKITVEAEEARAALNELHVAVSLLEKRQDDIGGNSTNEFHACFDRSIERLASSLFDAADPANLVENSCLRRLRSTTTLPNISDDLLWEAGYSLLRHTKVLSQSIKNKCCQVIVGISSVAMVCLQSLVHRQQLGGINRHIRTKAVTDFRLCECASILLEVLGCEKSSLFDGDATKADNFFGGAILLSCLAKILAISTMNCYASPPNSKNAVERRGPLSLWGAEKTVNLIVKQTALPFIELLMRGDGTALSISTKADYFCGAVECLYLLLRNWNCASPLEVVDQKLTCNQLSKHAAAILAPLVVDVLPDGKENQRANPLRSRTLNAISAFWELSYELVQTDQSSHEKTDRIMYISMPCQCMAVVIQAVRMAGRGKAQNNQNMDAPEINVSALARQLRGMIRNDDLGGCQPKFLNLLTLLCSAFPNASASQWHLFLERTGAEASPLLSILEEGTAALRGESYDDESWVALPSALRATSTLLNAMPFTLWISREERPSTRMTGGNFSSRVRNALLRVLECTANLMTAIKGRISRDWLFDETVLSYARPMENVMMEVSQVAGKLCTTLPFYGENSVLLQPASNLVECAGDIYVRSVKMILSQPLITEPELERSLMHKSISNFSKVIMQSLGINPDGLKITVSSAPTEKWLSDSSSYDFIGLLLTDSFWRFPLSEDRIEMLSSVARRSPRTLVREPFNLASFCEVCAIQCRSRNDSRILGLKLIESFTLGRKSYLANSVSNSMVFSVVPETLCPLLLAALEDHKASVRACAVSSFGSFLKSDWFHLFFSDAVKMKEQNSINWTTLEKILILCSANCEKNMSVRSSSCKTIGDICTVCIGETVCAEDNDTTENFSDGFILSFTCKICEVLIKVVLVDENAPVRSMALHAIGNMALGLKERCNERSSPQYSAIKGLFSAVCECLGDEDEKVVANAIRSISHIAYFVYHPNYASEIEKNTSGALDAYRSLLSDLSAKIQFAVEYAAGEMSSDLTWKRRNGAKKHAWGSCTTLGMLLSFTNILPYIDVLLLESAVSSIFRCVQLSNAINEKIVAAAVIALKKLPMSSWQHLSCKCDSIGRGLATCFGFLHEASFKRKSTSSYYHDIESLAHSLLTCAKTADFCSLFLIQESVPFSVEYFYQWLVTHNIEAVVLEKIAAAVSSQKMDHILDVAVVQMFLSRTIHQNRRQSLPCKVNVASLPLDEDGDDEL